MKKICSKCGLNKALGQYYRATQCVDGLRPECKTCNKQARSGRYRKAKVDQPLKRRSVVLKGKYGITHEDYEKMLISQEHKCAICFTTDSSPRKFFSVDHCHRTGRVRGLLCYLCNMGLGSFRDNTDLLRSSISYLENRNE